MPDNEIDLRAINELEKALDLKFGPGNSNSTKAFVGEYLGVDEEGQAWVKFSGNEFATPLTAQGVTADIGDMINVSVSNGYAIGDGNFTSPLATSSHVEQVVEPVGRAVENNRRDLLSTIKIAEEADAVAKATDQHFWDDTNGAHVTDLKKDDWLAGEADDFPDLSDSKPYHNLLMNSLGILLRRAHDNLVSITRSAITFFDGLGNAASNVVASFGANGAQIGKVSSTHVTIDSDSLDVVDGSSNVLAMFGASGIELGKSDGARAYFTGNYMMLVDSRYNGFLEIADYNYQYQDYDYSRKHFTLGSRGNAGQRGQFSIAIGNSNDATGDVSIAAGEGAASSGSYSSVIGGQQNTASSSYATTLGGFSNVASGQYSLAFGNNNTSSGSYSIAGGRDSASSGTFSIAIGDSAIASDSGEVAIGNHVSTGGYADFVIGSYNVIPTDSSQFKSFIIGNGTSDSRSNALSVDYSGNVVAGNTVTFGTNTEAEENGIKLKGGGTRDSWVLRTISAADGNGDAVLLGDGGMTIIGGGEAAANLWTALGIAAGNERLYLASDGPVYVTPNCGTVANRYTWEFNASGNLQSPSGGSYVANNGQFYADSDDLTSGAHPSSETNGKGIIFRDSANSSIGGMLPRFGTSSQDWQALRIYSQRSVSGSAKYNSLDLRLDSSGNQSVHVNAPAAWRTALGLGTIATAASGDYLKRKPASTSELPHSTATSGIFPIVLGDSFANNGVISYMTAANFRTAIGLGSAATQNSSAFATPSDYYSASSATQVNVADTSKYRFLVILFRTNSTTYTGGGASTNTSPLNSTVVHVNKKSSGSVYVSLNGNHAISGTSVQFRSGLATVTCSATAGKVVLSNQRYVNLSNGSAPEVGTDTSMALVGVIGIY